MKVLLVCDKHPSTIGGVEEHVRGLAGQLAARGFEVVIAYRKEGRAFINQLDFDSVRVGLDLLRLKRRISSLNPDVVHAHYSFNWLPLLAIAAASQLRLKVVVTCHSVLPGYDQDFLGHLYALTPHRPLLSKADALISVSRAVDLLMSRIVGSKVRRAVIPNAVDINVYAPSPREPKDPLVLYVGRLIYRKGVHVLLQAFRQVVKEERDAKLVVVGGGYLEPLLRTMASKFNLKGRVEFKGLVPDQEKASLYRSAWAVAVPTLYAEGFGIVAIEAMASGAPVVASKVGGLKEVVEDRVTGLLVKPGSAKELARVLLSLIQDPSLRRKLSSNARAKAVSNYSWRTVAGRVVDAYMDLRASPT
ncbi:MAG: hypothetical protein DRJ97_01720 [Thermoprotei archaeon]|nr:MAG: hypothetical protein DRJ97_01720 [Thermoprotei archaeon]